MHDVVEAGLAVAEQSDSDAGGNDVVAAGELARLGYGAQDFLGDELGDRGGIFGGRAEVFEDDDELVTAEAGHDIRLADALGDALGDLAQEFVSGAVAEGIVEGLEVVEIDEQDGAGGVGATAGSESNTLNEQQT